MSQTQRICTNNTAILRETDGTVKVILHRTAIVTITPDGRIILNSGGYQTATTRTRMNQVANEWKLGFQVFQHRGDWFVAIGRDSDQDQPFEDGMVLAPNPRALAHAAD